MAYFDIALWIDDVKNVPKQLHDLSKEVIVCRTYQQAITSLNKILDSSQIPKVLLCLDYHLGLKKTGTGADIANYIIHNKIPITCFTIVSIYAEGATQIKQLLEPYCHYESNFENVYNLYLEQQQEKEVIEEIVQPTTIKKKSIFARTLQWFRVKFFIFKNH